MNFFPEERIMISSNADDKKKEENDYTVQFVKSIVISHNLDKIRYYINEIEKELDRLKSSNDQFNTMYYGNNTIHFYKVIISNIKKGIAKIK